MPSDPLWQGAQRKGSETPTWWPPPLLRSQPTCSLPSRMRPVPQVVVDILKTRIGGRAPDEPAVTSPNGAMLRSNNWRRHTHWNKALKKTDLAPLTIHDLRHTYASLARKSGADLRYVQKTMGHSTPTVTANIYSDLYSDELDQVATNLDQLHATEIHTPKTGQEPDESN